MTAGEVVADDVRRHGPLGSPRRCWLRRTIVVTNAEVVILLAVVTMLMTVAFCTMTDNDLLRQRHERLIDNVNAKCVQHDDGSGECGPGTWSGVGVVE